jgi:hypothetical protein
MRVLVHHELSVSERAELDGWTRQHEADVEYVSVHESAVVLYIVGGAVQTQAPRSGRSLQQALDRALQDSL